MLWKREKSIPEPEIEPRILCRLAFRLVTILTELFWLQLYYEKRRWIDFGNSKRYLPVSLKEVCCVGQAGGGERERPLILLDAISAVAVVETTRSAGCSSVVGARRRAKFVFCYCDR
jgi:hypothetical protein